MQYSLIASTFAIIFIAELPDKSMVSSVILGSKMVPIRVFMGASVAFLVQVIIAVAVGGFVSKVPKRPLDLVVGLLFLIGAWLIFRDMKSKTAIKEDTIAKRSSREGLLSQVLLSFAITFLGEFGDITQIATANLAAKTADPISVGIGALMGLLSSTGIGIFLGSSLLAKIPVRGVQKVGILIMAYLGVIIVLSAL